MPHPSDPLWAPNSTPGLAAALALILSSRGRAAAFKEQELQEMIIGLGHDNEGCDAIERLKRALATLPAASLSRSFHGATPHARLLHLKLLAEIISDDEREALLKALDAKAPHPLIDAIPAHVSHIPAKNEKPVMKRHPTS